jgi:hypothetical protein
MRRSHRLIAFQESLDSPLDRRSEAYRHAAQTMAKTPERIMNLPNVLTFIRLLLVPVLIALWEGQWKYSPLICAVVFILASLTDWLDGYLAREVRQSLHGTVYCSMHWHMGTCLCPAMSTMRLYMQCPQACL